MRKLIVLAFFLFAANFVFAAEVGLEEAKNFARGWRGKNVSAARTHKTAAGESGFHIVSFEGGGWAAVGVDDEEAPVIAFSDEGADLVQDEKNPVWFLVKRDAEGRAAARREVKRKGGGGGKRKSKHKGWEHKRKVSAVAKAVADKEGQGEAESGVKLAEGEVKTAAVKTAENEGALEDVRVAPMLKSEWGQGGTGDYSNTPNCFNFHTPSNYVCGCVATMMAQIMRYFEWPKNDVAPISRLCMIDGTIQKMDMIGGRYDWSKMSFVPSLWNEPKENRQEIGKLCYDVGVSVHMMWSEPGSGAYTWFVREALVDTFQYSHAELIVFNQNAQSKYSLEKFKTIVVSNCEAGLPVGYGISGSSAGGHAVVIDGYGYTGEDFYVHINPGWGGRSNAWYCPPNLTMGEYSFDSSDELVYNIYTEGSGSIVCGKVVDQYGKPVEGATVSAEIKGSKISAITNEKGRYFFKTGVDDSSIFGMQVTVTKNGFESKKTTNLSLPKTMKGNRENPFPQNNDTDYLSDFGYSLGNKADLNFVLKQLPPPKVLFR